MDVYDALLAAADHIESFPEEFEYSTCHVPDATHCGTSGCAMGWALHFMGGFAGELICIELDGTKSFTDRQCTEFGGYLEFERKMDLVDLRWRTSVYSCSYALRKYAMTYHRPAVMEEA